MLIVESIRSLGKKLGIKIAPLLDDFGLERVQFYQLGAKHKPREKTLKKVNLIYDYLQRIERLLENEINVPLTCT